MNSPLFKRKIKEPKSYWEEGTTPYSKSRIHYEVINFIKVVKPNHEFEVFLHELKGG